jgi:hypothetical protein
MINRQYVCDLCMDEYPATNIIGLVQDGYWDSTNRDETDTHICMDCLESLARLYQRITAKERNNGQS